MKKIVTDRDAEECGGDSVAPHQGCDASGHLYRRLPDGRYQCTVCPHVSMTADHSGGISG